MTANPITTEQAARVVERYLAGRAPHTVRAYRLDLEQLRSHLGAPTPEAAVVRLLAGGREDANGTLLRFRAAVRRTSSRATERRRLAAMRSLVRAAQGAGVIRWRLEVADLGKAS